MAISKTLFIVGAGASDEVQLPIGNVLKKQIARKVNFRFGDSYGQELQSGDHNILSALREHARQANAHNKDINPYLHAGRRIHDGITQADSIDYFLSSNATDEEMQLCGKLGIVRCILAAERKSPLWVDGRETADPRPNLSQVEDTWYNRLFTKLFNGLGKEEVKNRLQNIDFIVFNYDRCIEHYFLNAARNLYGINENEAVDLIKPLNVIHPYGTIGDLPWQNSNNHVPYGNDNIGGQKMLDLSQKISTFTEQIKEKTVIPKMQKLVQNADTILFLGFGFHPQNMKMLKPENRSQAKNIFATAFGESKSNCISIRDDIFEVINNPASIEIRSDLKCAAMLGEYNRSLNI